MKVRFLGMSLILGGILLLVLFLGMPKLVAYTSKNTYCASCHVMEDQYVSLRKAGIHNQLNCVDCHLPQDNKIRHYFWKGVDGTKDLVKFHFNLVPEEITISSHGKKIVQENCIRCHQDMVSMINVKDRYCWECHVKVRHKTSASLETLEK
ncbi:cytochrome c nitrite reductase small subunit [Thermodesulfobacterium sp. TA1]|uniref:cytochrome c nitrite reductase small subunit n=1 Tax=Thermodesulfobacterium sp. TA1 TaxID=2234087 RepID=UPI0012319020|nr:cytochrome c nitrite reductase small subunit [Thermodesulfobacterium sp. TA1]QER42425.1 cytochrome c nitrite reductase small subunit [Thermodesulfobacterium sp. TA1]